MTRTFEIQTRYAPSGDQPQAIHQLTQGVEAGLAHQTLLGVTGSGKSVGYDDPLFLVEHTDAGMVPTVQPAGEVIDSLIDQAGVSNGLEDETEAFAPSSRRYYTYAFDPRSGVTGLYPVGAFIRHVAPREMYRLSTRCGREVTLTGDHNLWVLRNGNLTLVRTDDVRPGDCVPVPRALTCPGRQSNLDAVSALRDSQLFVDATAGLMRLERRYGTTSLAAALRSVGVRPYPKLHKMRRGSTGSGLSAQTYLRLVEELAERGMALETETVTIGGKRQEHRIAGSLELNTDLLRIFGYYLSEGNCQARYTILANHHPAVRARIETALARLGIQYRLRPSTDYQISSASLTALLSASCGATAKAKRLPSFWAALPEESLGTLLQAYFDGDGWVESKGEVCAVTASRGLASDLAYALLRFGMWARIRRVHKRATNTGHRGGWYYQVGVSGQDDLARFVRSIGFGHPDKQAALRACVGRRADTNLDRVPIDGSEIRTLRVELNMSMKALAAGADCSRSMVSLIESGRRAPSSSLLRRLLNALRDEAAEVITRSMGWFRQWQRLRSLCDLRWTCVREIEAVTYNHPYVYDLSVPGAETFVAGTGGLIVHNTFTIGNVIQRIQRPTLILAPNKTLAAQLYGEMRELFPHSAVEYFVSYYDYYQPEAYVPSSDTFIEKDASINEHIEQMRLSATKAVLEREDVIVVATVSSIYGLGDPGTYLAMVLHLARGHVMDQRDILRRLAELQYTRNDVELQRGTYRVRGEVIDIYPAESEGEAVRVELFDDEIEQLSYFDPLTGEVQRRVPRLTIYPKTHYVTPRETIMGAIDHIKAELRERLEQLRSVGKELEAQRLEQRTLFDIEMLQELGYCHGIENYSRYLSGRSAGQPPPTLFDYLPQDALLVIDESHVTIPQLGGMYKGDRSRKETLVEYGFRLPSALDNRPLRFDEFERIAPQAIYVSATPGRYEHEKSGGDVIEQVVRPTGLVDPEVEVRPASSQVDDLLSEVRERATAGQRVLVTTLTKRMAEDLTEYLAEHGVSVRYLHSDIDTVERVEIIRDLRLGKFDVLVGINLLREGLDMPEVALVGILDADKEGFLRGETALIQTIGRAARNLHGKAILYADHITGSMRRALDETERRRNKQIAYNAEHGITPRGIEKAVSDVMEGAYTDAPRPAREYAKAAEDYAEYAALPPDQLARKLEELEEQMNRHARDLEFEEAARLRDQIRRIHNASLGLPDTGTG